MGHVERADHAAHPRAREPQRDEQRGERGQAQRGGGRGDQQVHALAHDLVGLARQPQAQLLELRLDAA